MKVRGQTIAYSAQLKKQLVDKDQKNLEEKIEENFKLYTST
jgi:hypothetical protein